jgi:ribonuclease HI
MINAMYSSLSNTKHAKINLKNIFYHMNFDGCSKGNPGLAGAGAVIYNDQFQEIWGGSLFVGQNITNNHSEYAGLLLGLEKAIQLDIKSLIVRGDSQLVINHMTGKYKCKNDKLLELYTRAKNLERNFQSIQYIHVLRDSNKRADELSNIPVKEFLTNYLLSNDK